MENRPREIGTTRENWRKCGDANLICEDLGVRDQVEFGFSTPLS